MVIVPRIAVVSCLSTTPFIYGIRHEDNLRAELSLSSPSESTRLFVEGLADLALIPAAAYPTLKEARLVTEYCVGGVPKSLSALLASDDPLVEAWKPYGKLPCAFALWVARPEVEPETVEALQYNGVTRRFWSLRSPTIRAAPTRVWPISTTFSTTRKTRHSRSSGTRA